MAKKNIQWINSRDCWRFSKYERMTGKMSPYKLFAKDAGVAAWELFKQIKHTKIKGEQMKVNFNGMRKVATSDMNRLHSVLDELLSKYSDTLSPYEQEAIIEAYNRAAQSVEIFNCLYDDNVEGDMDDLSDMGVNRLAGDGD